MSKKHPARSAGSSASLSGRKRAPIYSGDSRRPLIIGVAAFIVLAVAAGVAIQRRGASPKVREPAYVPQRTGTLTFNRDVAPIIFQNCSWCHRPGQSAPFTLLSLAGVKKHAAEIARVTASRSMTPWLPEPGYEEFSGQRRLNPDELAMLQQWVAEGCHEGDPADLPPMPQWVEGWQLGVPDLIVQLPKAYLLAAEGRDVYRNFVIPIPLALRRYVKAVEFLPGNWRVVHHAFVMVDRTQQSRRAAQGNPPGFDGMQVPETVTMPSGQRLGWQPSAVPVPAPEGLSWVLEPDTDLVLQLHMRPSGKPETVQPSVGFYFTPQPPTNFPFRVNLSYYKIDIPPGAKDYSVEQTYVLPVDVDALLVSPHAHYLGKKLQGFATLPDGSRQWLIRIKNWDFSWQGSYRFARPVFLPKGATLTMHYSYDNSTDNMRNPNQPPRRVQYGLQTTDEMAELWLQVLPHRREHRSTLARDFLTQLAEIVIDFERYRLAHDPQDGLAHAKVANALLFLGRDMSEALDHLRTAAQLEPDYAQIHYDLGSIYLRQSRPTEAKLEFETLLKLKPEDYQAHGSLGYIFLREGSVNEAELHFREALRINPNDPVAKKNLELLFKARGLVEERK